MLLHTRYVLCSNDIFYLCRRRDYQLLGVARCILTHIDLTHVRKTGSQWLYGIVSFVAWINSLHYSNVTWASKRTLPVNRLYAQRFVHRNDNDNTKALHYWPFCGVYTLVAFWWSVRGFKARVHVRYFQGRWNPSIGDHIWNILADWHQTVDLFNTSMIVAKCNSFRRDHSHLFNARFHEMHATKLLYLCLANSHQSSYNLTIKMSRRRYDAGVKSDL